MRRGIVVAAMVSVLALAGCSTAPQTQDTTDDAAVQESEEAKEVDKSGLEETIAEVESTTLEGLTLDTGTKLSTAYDEAVAVMNDDEAEQYEVDSAQRALISAFDSASRESEAYSSANDAIEETPVEETTNGTIGEGTHLVGTDIEAGEYKLTATGSVPGYWEVTNSSAPDADIIGNDNFDGNAYVTVSDGQYLKLNRCMGEKVN